MGIPFPHHPLPSSSPTTPSPSSTRLTTDQLLEEFKRHANTLAPHNGDGTDRSATAATAAIHPHHSPDSFFFRRSDLVHIDMDPSFTDTNATSTTAPSTHLPHHRAYAGSTDAAFARWLRVAALQEPTHTWTDRYQ